jgi:hypothetical protein
MPAMPMEADSKLETNDDGGRSLPQGPLFSSQWLRKKCDGGHIALL